MAQGLASPIGLFSDEEAALSPVLESTAAECGLRRALLPDFSAISADQEPVRLGRREEELGVRLGTRVSSLPKAETTSFLLLVSWDQGKNSKFSSAGLLQGYQEFNIAIIV